MALRWYALGDPYRPGTFPIIKPWIAPDRRTLITFRRLWPWVSWGIVCTIIMVATLPLERNPVGFWVAIGVLAGYLLWSLAFSYLERHFTGSLAMQQRICALRKLGMIAGLTATLFFLPTASPELWLLYLIPMVKIGVDLDRVWAFVLIGITMAVMFCTAFLPFGSTPPWPALLNDVRDGLMRALVGCYIGLGSYFLTRCLAYQNSKSHQALDHLLVETVSQRWVSAPNVVAKVIADLFSEPGIEVTANVLMYRAREGQMALVGSSQPSGQRLANAKYEFPAQQGVTSWAAVHDKPCFLNDTQCDPEGRFLALDDFPDTRSALAVPFRLDDDTRAVIEIESGMPDNIAYEDLQLMQLIASYLVGAYRTSEWLEFHRQLVDLGSQLAERIINVQDIGEMLQTIGETALELVDADVIGFHYRHPDSGEIQKRRTVGRLLGRENGESPVNEPGSLVYRLMQQGQVRFFTDAQQDEQLTRVTPWHIKHDQEPFVVREKIASCAAVPLIVGQERLGLMWVNYRMPQEFEESQRYSIQMLAPFAALAIKSGIQSAQAERERQEQLNRKLHDSLKSRLENAARAMERLGVCEPRTPEWNEAAQLAHLSVKWALTVVDALMGRRTWSTVNAIIFDLQTHADVSSRIFNIPIHFHADPMVNLEIDHSGSNELLFACDEAINNALRHAGASVINIDMHMDREQVLYIAICDDGIGFERSAVSRVNGLANMRARIESTLNGQFRLQSALNQGTQIIFEIPLKAQKGGKDGSPNPAASSVSCRE